MSPSPADRLRHIRDECAFLLRVVAPEPADSFAADETLTRAAERSFSIIGEAVKALPETVRDAAPETEWRQIARMRDFLSHVYFHVLPSVLWNTVQNDVPPLIAVVDRLIKQFDRPEAPVGERPDEASDPETQADA